MIHWIIGGIVAGILLLAIFGDHMIAPIDKDEKDAHDPY